MSTSGAGDVQMNGVAAGGTGVTVDGTEANSNPEARSLAQHGGQNQISVMSLDSIAEVQIVKGVLPAEYGGVAGGQINVISRSGTNTFHGSAFYSGQNEKFNARSFFSSAAAGRHVPSARGTLGGPILRSKRSSSPPTRATTRTCSRTSTWWCRIRSSGTKFCGRCHSPRRGRCWRSFHYRPSRSSRRRASSIPDRPVARSRNPETHGECPSHQGRSLDLQRGSLAVTYTRLRPFTLEPRAVLDNANDREYPNEQDRVAAQLTATRGRWVSESRVGWNRTYLARLDAFLNVMQPNAPPEILPAGRRMPAFSITNLFATPRSEIWDMKGITYSFEQKLSRSFQRHLLKAGFRFMRETGGRLNPENPSFTYQTYAICSRTSPSR